MFREKVKNLLNRNGFTLIEVMITIAIIGIVVIPISSYFVQAARLNSAAKEKLAAIQIAQRYLERYKANSKSFVSSSIEEKEYQESEAGDYHVKVEVAPYSVKPEITPKFDYKYAVGSDELNNTDMTITVNDENSDTDKNSVLILKNGESSPFFSGNTNSKDVILDIVINSDTPNILFTGWQEVKDGTFIDSKSWAYKLSTSIFTPSHNAEYIKVFMNSDKRLILNVQNELTKEKSTECIIYIVRPKGKTGEVLGFSTLGKTDFIDYLYDKSVIAGLPEHGLYKITVTVYKGVDSSGKKLYVLDSLMK